MDLATAAALLGGLVLLVAGAEALVRGASRLAAALGVAPLAIGLTVVAFGTSAPELAVSVRGAVTGAGDVAVGNALGSNVFNLLAVLGLSAATSALVVHRRLVRLDVPVLLAVTAAVWLLAVDGTLGRMEGVGLVLGLLAYTTWTYRSSRRAGRAPTGPVADGSSDAEAVASTGTVAEESVDAEAVASTGPVADGSSDAEAVASTGPVAPEPGAPDPESGRVWQWAVLAVVVGLAGLVAGAQLLVAAATTLAQAAGVGELTIGLTVVAAGTSLPELATSVAAAARGQRDLAVGNVVGSNLFNLLGVLGASALLAGDGLPVAGAAVRVDLPVTLLATLVVLPCLVSGLVIARWEGGLLLAAYGGYLAVTVLTGLEHPAAPTATGALVAGLVAVGAVVTAVGWRQRGAATLGPPGRP